MVSVFGSVCLSDQFLFAEEETLEHAIKLQSQEVIHEATFNFMTASIDEISFASRCVFAASEDHSLRSNPFLDRDLMPPELV